MIGAIGPSNYPAYQPDFTNQTGATLAKGDVVMIDWMQQDATSTPSATQAAAGIDAVQLGMDNAVVPTTLGINAGNAFAVVLDDTVAIGARFKCIMQGVGYVNAQSVVNLGDNLVPQNGSKVAAVMGSKGPALCIAKALDALASSTGLIRCWINGLPQRMNQGSV